MFTDNKRSVTFIDSPAFGTVAYVCIGALLVGSIIHTSVVGRPVIRGQEHGYFAYGGSTIVILLAPNRSTWDKDLLEHSEQKHETMVKVGEAVGRAREM